MRKLVRTIAVSVSAVALASELALFVTSASASTPKPLPPPFSWTHVPDRVADELHISDNSVVINTNDTQLIVTPRGRVFTS